MFFQLDDKHYGVSKSCVALCLQLITEFFFLLASTNPLTNSANSRVNKLNLSHTEVLRYFSSPSEVSLQSLRARSARRAWTARGSYRVANSQLSSIRWSPPWRHTVVWRHGAFFVCRQHSTESDFPSTTKVYMESWLIYSSSAKQCLLSVNLKQFLNANGTEQQTQERLL